MPDDHSSVCKIGTDNFQQVVRGAKVTEACEETVMTLAVICLAEIDDSHDHCHAIGCFLSRVDMMKSTNLTKYIRTE